MREGAGLWTKELEGMLQDKLGFIRVDEGEI